MAHNLYQPDHQAALMVVGAPPWHGLGQRLEHPPTSAEAIRAARLDWTVSKHPIYAEVGSRYLRVPDQFVLMPDNRLREKDCPVFGVVGADYLPFQNAEAFRFFDPVITAGKATYETAGALGDGERVWVLVRMAGEMRVAGTDEVDRYLLLSNSHDGKSSVQVRFTPIRVVCQNTLSIALGQGRGYRVQHTQGMWRRLQGVAEILGLVDDRFAEIHRAFEAMARVAMQGGRLAAYLADVFPAPEAPPRRASAEEARAAGKAHEEEKERIRLLKERAAFLFEKGRGNTEPPVRGTLWAAYNGVVEMMDYHTAHRSDESLLRSAWFGDRYLTKARALRVGTARAHEWGGASRS